MHASITAGDGTKFAEDRRPRPRCDRGHTSHEGARPTGDDGSPFNKVAGLGFAGVPEPEALDGIERAFAARGAPTQIELAHLGDPDIGVALTGQGYRLESFENVLGRPLDAMEAPPPPAD